MQYIYCHYIHTSVKIISHLLSLDIIFTLLFRYAIVDEIDKNIFEMYSLTFYQNCFIQYFWHFASFNDLNCQKSLVLLKYTKIFSKCTFQTFDQLCYPVLAFLKLSRLQLAKKSCFYQKPKLKQYQMCLLCQIRNSTSYYFKRPCLSSGWEIPLTVFAQFFFTEVLYGSPSHASSICRWKGKIQQISYFTNNAKQRTFPE